MRKTWWMVFVVTYGESGEWMDEEQEVFDAEYKAIAFAKEMEDQVEKVGGIDDVDTNIEEVTEERLRSLLTVDEYIKLYPEVGKLLDDYFE